MLTGESHLSLGKHFCCHIGSKEKDVFPFQPLEDNTYLLLVKIKGSQNWLRLDGNSGEPPAHLPAQSRLLRPVSRMGVSICKDGDSSFSEHFVLLFYHAQTKRLDF